MCWINWFIKASILEDDAKNLIKNMNKAIRHRWPDDEWFYVEKKDDKTIWLGQVRLSIIDLSPAWHQPMFYDKKIWASNDTFVKHEAKDLVILFNWEIYNFLDIKNELEIKWYNFSTLSDTEIILASYLEYWEDCVNHFNWMWAFVIYDKNNSKLFCSRDRLWKKPFYYYYDSNNFIFSSEIKWILEHKELNINTKENIDKEAIDFYLTTWYIPSPWTIYKNIKKLEARHNISLKLDTINNNLEFNKYCYYEIPKYAPVNNKNSLIEEWKYLLEDATKIRMFADVPVWAFLSWWLDSSTVVWEMIKFTKRENLHTFSIWFEWKNDESNYINIVKDYFNTNHHHEYFKKENFEEILESIYHYYDEPYWDYSNFPSIFVSRLAKKDVTVSLSWDWWDEIFGWYMMHQVWAQMSLLYKLPKFIKKIAYYIVPKTSDNLSILSKIKEALRVSMLPKEEFYANIWWSSIYKPEVYKKWTIEKFKEVLEKSNWNFTQAMIDYDLFYNSLWDNFCVKVDRASMSVALEVRSPFLDYRFIEYSRKIPTKWKVTWRKTKILMREIIKEIVPGKIAYRWKQWFEPPLRDWILEEKYTIEIKKWLEELFKNWIIDNNWYNFYDKCVMNNSNIIFNVFKIKLFLLIKWYDKWIESNI